MGATSVTSLYSTIGRRAIFAADEFDHVRNALLVGHHPRNDNNHYNSNGISDVRHLLERMSVALRSLSRIAAMLLRSTGNAQSISTQMQAILEESLRSCDSTVSQSHEQATRLGGDLDHAKAESFDAYITILLAQRSLFLYLCYLLSGTEAHSYDERLSSFTIQHLFNQTRHVIQATNGTSRSSVSIDEHLPTVDEKCRLYNLSVSSEKSQKKKREHHEPGRHETPSGAQCEPPPLYSLEDPNLSAVSPAKAASTPTSQTCSKQWEISSTPGKAYRALTNIFRPRIEPLVSGLCQASFRGDVQQVAAFLSEDANIDGINEEGNTALKCSILSNQLEVARLLISSGAVVDGPAGWSSLPPLFLAASIGNIEIAKLLLEKGVRLKDNDLYDDAYFYDVVSHQNIAGTRLLLDNGANPNASSAWAGQPASTLAVKKSNFELTQLLLDYGADANGFGNLVIAVQKGQANLVALLIDRGANPNSQNWRGKCVLAQAVDDHRLDIVRLLLVGGADPNSAMTNGQTILTKILTTSKLTETERIELTHTLLQRGATVNTTEAESRLPPICYALDTGIMELILSVLQYKPKLDDLRMSSGETLLTHAIGIKHREIAILLIIHGVDPNERNHKGMAAVDMALLKQDYEMVKLLSEGGADPRSVRTAVENYAGHMGRPEIITKCGIGVDSLGLP